MKDITTKEDNMKQITFSQIVFYLMKKHGIGAYRVEETNTTFEITKNGMFDDIAVSIEMGTYLNEDTVKTEIDLAIIELEKLLDAEQDRLTKKLMDSLNMEDITIRINGMSDIDDSVLR